MKIAALVLMAGLVLAQDEARTERLIQALGDPEYAEREKARGELLKIGAPALKALEAARKHPDPEIAQSARDLAERIRKAQTLQGLIGPGTRISVHVQDTPLEEAAPKLGLTLKIPDPLKTARVTLDFDNAELLRVLDSLALQLKEASYRFENATTVVFFNERWIEYPTVYSGPFKISVVSVTTTARKEFRQNSSDIDLLVSAEREGAPASMDYSISLDEALDQDGKKIERLTTSSNAVPGPMIKTNGVTVRVLHQNGRVRVVTEGDAAALGGQTLSLLQVPIATSKLQSLRGTMAVRLATPTAKNLRIEQPAAGSRHAFGEGAIVIEKIEDGRIDFSLRDLPPDVIASDTIVLQSQGKDYPTNLMRVRQSQYFVVSIPDDIKTLDAVKLSLREVVHHKVPFEFKNLDLR
jgi:hypothetical protein